MRKYLDHIRKKPDSTKKYIAFGASSVVLMGILTIWIATFSVRFPGLVLNNTPEVYTADASNTSAVDALRQQFSAGAGYTDVEVQNILNSNGIVDTPSSATTSTSGYYGDNQTVIISDPQSQ